MTGHKMDIPGDPTNPDGNDSAEIPDEDEVYEDELVEVHDLDDLPGEFADDMDAEAVYSESAHLEPPQDDSMLVFQNHKDAVFCVRCDRGGQGLVVTGGKDDTAYVWHQGTGQIKFQCQGHRDSVTCVGFSHDSQYVCTADMSGILRVWETKNGKHVWSFDTGDLQWIDWHPLAHVLMAGATDGTSYMWKIPEGACKAFHGGGAASNVGRILPDGCRVCVGYNDGEVKVWDMKTCEVMAAFTGYEAHTDCITTMDCNRDNNLVITGSADQTAALFNTSSGKLLCRFDCHDTTEGASEKENSVETVGFSLSQPMAATGTLRGALSIWDLHTQKQRHLLQHEAGIVKCVWDPVPHIIYTGTLDAVIHAWDTRNGQRIKQWFGHHGEILDMDICKVDGVLVSSSEDHTARVFSLK